MSSPAMGDIGRAQFTNLWTKIPRPISILDPGPHNASIVGQVIALKTATAAINAKAAALSAWVGNPTSEVEVVPQGYVRHFVGVDIYFRDEAHEVHGDIRAKYNALQGPWGVLGLPITDETGTPDGIGRFNHFDGGSIYWTGYTGPMMVRGSIRDVWAEIGWERSPLGYPVADEYRFRTINLSTDPVTVWSLFENGAIVATPDGTGVALTADVAPDQLRTLIRKRFDEAFHKRPDNIGLQAPIETIAISDWRYDFWTSHNRMVTFRLHGFHDNGLAPDTDFELDVRLRFGLTWPPTFTEPDTKTLVVELDSVTVAANGPASGDVADGVAHGVADNFQQAQPIVDIPVGGSITGRPPDFLGVVVTKNGGLQALLNPMPPNAGALRKLIADQQIVALLDA